MTDNRVKYVLDERDLPRYWYNIQADLPVPLAPPLHPGTGQPLTPDDLAPLFPMACIMQEVRGPLRCFVPAALRSSSTPLRRSSTSTKA